MPWPAMTNGSLYGWTRVSARVRRSSSTVSNASCTVPPTTTSAPYALLAATFVARAYPGITIVARSPSTAAA